MRILTAHPTPTGGERKPMIVRRSKRLETTFDMISPGEVFEDAGTWYMKLDTKDDANGLAVELITGKVAKYSNIEEYPVIVIAGEFVAKG